MKTAERTRIAFQRGTPDRVPIHCWLGLPLIKELEGHGVEVLPLKMRHARNLSGGFHCVTVDVRRKGQLEDYS